MKTKRLQRALLAFGANLPFQGLAPDQTLHAAAESFPSVSLPLPRLSRFFATPCFPAGSGPDYVNAAAVLEVDESLSPQTLLDRLHTLEAKFGRERERRWGMRTLDIDLLAIEDMVLPDAATQAGWRNLDTKLQRKLTPEQLILPHPRLQDRAFVLVPLAEIAPQWTHPILHQTVAQMLAAVPPADIAEIRPI